MRLDKFISYGVETSIRLPKINPSKGNHPDEDELDKMADFPFIEIFHVNNWPVQNRKALEKIAQYFRREFSYDFVQFDRYETNKDKERYFLFGNTHRLGETYAIGGCCFRWREWTDHPPGMALQWIWFHPYFRDKGILSAYWPGFRKLYGNFDVEAPLSSSMKGFLTKMKETK